MSDLYNLYQLIVLNKRSTVLELGCGFSTLIMHLALKENEKFFGPKKPFERCKFPYHIFFSRQPKKIYKNCKKKNF